MAKISCGFCQCGCGNKTAVAKHNRPKQGIKKGEPLRYLAGHNARRHRSPKDALLKHVQIGAPCECWEWQGALAANGYGVLSVNSKTVFAHRLSYELYVGDIPPSTCVCHTCDNRKCCNPNHLFLGSIADNLKDMFNKKRHAYGEKTGSSVLTESEVKEIRQLAKVGWLQREIGEKFGVARTTVSQIVTRKIWKHVE